MLKTQRSLCPSILTVALACAASCGGGGAGGGGGGGGGQTPLDPPLGSAVPPYVATLVSAAAGSGSARLHWVLPGGAFEAALFRSTSAATVYAGSPVLANLTGTSTTVGGLTNGTKQFFGLGVRPNGGGNYTPSGAVLRVLPTAPIYVDAAAASGGANGSSPATAFPTIALGLALAAANGGGNVWVKDGTYSASRLVVADDVHLYGGFGAAFSLAGRSPRTKNTILHAPAGQVLFDVNNVAESAVIDGMCLDGQNAAAVGVDVDDAEVELRSLDVRAFSDRGIRIRSALITNELDIVIAGCEVTRNGADGVSLLGAFDLRIHGSSFDANIQEGIELDDLVALDGGHSVLLVEGCRFFGNGTDGFDADLAPPLLAPATSGRFEVEIRASRFERNGGVGLLIDHDFEALPGYKADIVVRECIARANGAAGLYFDADGPGGLAVYGCLISGNIGDGLVVSSDSDRNVAVVSATALTGNLGAGVRTQLGNKTVVTSHCIFAGNGGGGVVSAGPGSATSSSVYYLQNAPQQNVRSWFDVTVTDPFAGVFLSSPEEYLHVTARMENDLTVAGMPNLMPGVPIELNDDGAALTATQVVVPVISASSLPAGFTVPSSLTVFANAASVLENYQLPGGSPALGQGLTTLGGPAQDAGVFGAPSSQAPGTAEETRRKLLLPSSITPPPVTLLGANQSVAIDFSKTLMAASVTSNTVRATRTEGGAGLNIGLSTSAARLTVSAPAGGWGNQDFVIELQRGIQGQDGTQLATPIALAFRR